MYVSRLKYSFKVTIDVQIQNTRHFVRWIMPHFNGKRLIIKMN